TPTSARRLPPQIAKKPCSMIARIADLHPETAAHMARTATPAPLAWLCGSQDSSRFHVERGLR
ncbi:MAG: hypothetical protein ACE10K_15330, partial [Rhodothermales bacterium]